MTLAESIAEKLAGWRTGSGYVCQCPAHEDHDPSLSLKDGDEGGLIVHCFVGCQPRDIYQALRAKGLLDGSGDKTERPPPARGTSEYKRQRQELAAWLWSKRRPVNNSPVAKYLIQRGYTGPVPATLGHLPARGRHPDAMIAAFGFAPKDIIGVHLNKLTAAGDKIAERIDASGRKIKAKVMIGTCQGRPIALAPPNDLLGLAITEGIEDGLSVYAATGLGVWVASGATFMPALAPMIPSYVEAISIYADADNAGQGNAHKLARALNAQRRDQIARNDKVSPLEIRIVEATRHEEAA
jgi:Toprim domain